MAAARSKKSKKVEDEERAAIAGEIVTEQDAGQELVLADEFEEFEGEGFEDIGAEELIRPRLKVLQVTSDQCKRAHSAYIEGAEPGMFYNTSTGKIYNGEKGLNVVIVGFTHHFVQYKGMKPGGGWAQNHHLQSPIVAKAIAANGGKINKELHVLVPPTAEEPGRKDKLAESFDFMLMVLDESGSEIPDLLPCAFSMQSTKCRTAREWLSKLHQVQVLKKLPNGGKRKIKPPMRLHRTHLSTFLDTNGNDNFYSVSVSPIEGAKSWLECLIRPSQETELVNIVNEAYAACKKMSVDEFYEADQKEVIETNADSAEDLPFG